jgi:hypothetical protein
MKVEDFYGGGVIDDSDTPAEAFRCMNSPKKTASAGLFMMIYDQPPQFDMKEFFRPLASLEVQYGIDEADLLLSTLARVGNFAMEPLRVHAFFKRTPGWAEARLGNLRPDEIPHLPEFRRASGART